MTEVSSEMNENSAQKLEDFTRLVMQAVCFYMEDTLDYLPYDQKYADEASQLLDSICVEEDTLKEVADDLRGFLKRQIHRGFGGRLLTNHNTDPDTSPKFQDDEFQEDIDQKQKLCDDLLQKLNEAKRPRSMLSDI